VSDPVVYGATYSVYTRIAQLVLKEKGIPYRLEEIDIFAKNGPPSTYGERNPFLRIPAFEMDGFQLYEASAITRFIDDVFPDPPLMPDTAKNRGRVHQIIGILDSYAYRTWVWDIFFERIRVPERGEVADESKIANAIPQADICLTAIEDLMGGRAFFCLHRANVGGPSRSTDDRPITTHAGGEANACRSSALVGVVAGDVGKAKHDRHPFPS